MRTHGPFVALGLGAVLALCGCARSGRAELPGPEPKTVHATIGHPICDAIESAEALLAGYKATWGEPRQVLRTGSNWYRIEYAKAEDGSERVVLVNPTDGHAEFPLRR